MDRPFSQAVSAQVSSIFKLAEAEAGKVDLHAKTADEVPETTVSDELDSLTTVPTPDPVLSRVATADKRPRGQRK